MENLNTLLAFYLSKVIFIAELRADHESGKQKAMASKWNEEDSPAIMLIKQKG